MSVYLQLEKRLLTHTADQSEILQYISCFREYRDALDKFKQNRYVGGSVDCEMVHDLVDSLTTIDNALEHNEG